ncbi:MAG: DEAD/DEAH box helicase [Spirochaetales bacterium]|nr:DEAD/DEAH box helicase [Spirochaetales bacterium]
MILKGKCLAIEAGKHTGKTAALILPVMTRFLKGKGGIKAVVLVPDLEIAKKVSREIKKFIPVSNKSDPFLILGLQEGGKNDYRQLQRKPKVLIGTSEKIIDHIRRGNLDFSNIKLLAADMPTVNEVPGFIQDVFFIQSKLPRKTQHVFIYPKELSEIDELLSSSAAASFQCVNKVDWDKTTGNTNLKIIEVQKTQDKVQAIYDLFYGKKMTNLIILNNLFELNNVILQNLKKATIHAQLLSNEAIEKDKSNLISKFNNQLSRILLIPDTKLNSDKFLNASHLIFFNPPAIDMKNIKTTLHSIANIKEAIFLTTPNETQKIESLKETTEMNIEKAEYPEKEDIYKGYIHTILDRIKNSESIEELETFKKTYKKNVPFFMRSYFTAYILKEILSNKKQPRPRSKSIAPSSPSFSSSTDSSIVTMFVSIGKNRRVFPKDLMALFMTTLNMKKSDIKDIKVLDSYSFVDIPSHYGKDAISKLSGMDYKGRKINVNFARKKERPQNKN